VEVNQRIRPIIFWSLIILFAFSFIFFNKSKKADVATQEDLASSVQMAQPQKSFVKSKSQVRDIAQNTEQTIPAAESSKSGKYGLQFPQTATSIQVETAKRDRYLSQHKADLVIKSEDQKFMLMDLRASRQKKGSGGSRALDNDLFPIDLETARKVIVDNDTYPVVYRETNGRIGLLTGVILIQTTDESEAVQLSKSFPMDLQIYDPDIRLASYKVHSGEGLFEVYKRIKSQYGKVDSVTVEVLDSYKGYGK
jgi:hypothetical protein